MTIVPLFGHVDLRARVSTARSRGALPATLLLGFWFVMQLFSAGAVAATAATQGGGVAFMAHTAGFAMGLIGVLLFRRPERTDARWT